MPLKYCFLWKLQCWKCPFLRFQSVKRISGSSDCSPLRSGTAISCNQNIPLWNTDLWIIYWTSHFLSETVGVTIALKEKVIFHVNVKFLIKQTWPGLPWGLGLFYIKVLKLQLRTPWSNAKTSLCLQTIYFWPQFCRHWITVRLHRRKKTCIQFCSEIGQQFVDCWCWCFWAFPLLSAKEGALVWKSWQHIKLILPVPDRVKEQNPATLSWWLSHLFAKSGDKQHMPRISQCRQNY